MRTEVHEEAQAGSDHLRVRHEQTSFDWECEECADEDPPEYPIAIVVEDTVNWRGEYWERSLHPSEARYKEALGQWVPEGYKTELEELHHTVATNALETKFNAS